MNHVKDFGKKYFARAVEATRNTGLFPETLIAQAALESGWGRSRHAKDDVNNLFGIKADSSWKGRVISSSTKEFEKGSYSGKTGTNKFYKNRTEAINDGANPSSLFRVYDDDTTAIKDWVSFLKQNTRYTNAGVFEAKTPEEQFAALKKGGYATSPTYVEKLTNVLNLFKKNNAELIKSVKEKISDVYEEGEEKFGSRNIKIGIGIIIVTISVGLGLFIFTKIKKQIK